MDPRRAAAAALFLFGRAQEISLFDFKLLTSTAVQGSTNFGANANGTVEAQASNTCIIYALGSNPTARNTQTKCISALGLSPTARNAQTKCIYALGLSPTARNAQTKCISALGLSPTARNAQTKCISALGFYFDFA
jgi:precorrin isomerase